MADFINKEIEQVEKFVKLVDELKKELKDASKYAEELVKNINVDKARSKEIQELTKAQQILVTTTKELSKIEKQEADAIAKLNALKAGERDEIIKLQIEQKKLMKEKREDLDVEKQAGKVYREKSKTLRRLKNEYKDLALEEKENTKEAKKLLRQIGRLDKELKELDKTVGDTYREIGNYSEAIKDAIKEQKKQILSIATLVGAVKGLGSSLNSSEEGNERMRKATGRLGAVVDVTANTVATAALDLWDFGAALFSGEKNLSDIGDAFEETGKSLDSYTEDVKNAVDASDDVVESTIELEKATRDYAQTVALLNRGIEQQNLIAGDSTRSFDEIQEATEKALALEQARNATLLKQAKEELRILKTRRIEGKQQIELEDEIAAKRVEIADINTDLILSIEELEKTQNENRRDRFERQLDFAIDAFDVQKTLNERRFADERKSLEERRAIFRETEMASKSSFENQIALVQDYTKQEVDLKALIEEKDEEVVRKRLEGYNLDDVTLGRILEIYREQIMLKGDLLDMERELEDAIKERAESETEAITALTQFRFERAVENAEEIDDIENARIAETKFRYGVLLDQDFEFAEERKLLEEQLEQELTQIKKDASEERNRIAEEEFQKQNELAQKQREEAFKIAKDITGELGNELQKRNEETLNSLDEQIAFSEEQIERQEQLAEQGLDNQLAFEKERLAKINQQRKEELQRQQQQEEAIKLAEAFISAFEARVQDDPDTAVQKATQDVIVARTVAKSLVAGFAYDGTEDTGQGKGMDEKNGMLWMVHPNERIMSKKQNELVGDLTNDELASLAFNYRMGSPINETARQSNNKDVVNSIQDLKETIKNRPIQKVDIDKLGNIIEIIDNGNFKKVTKLKTRPRL